MQRRFNFPFFPIEPSAGSVFLTFFLFISLSLPGSAWALEEHLASWTGAFFQGKFEENWGWYAETQTRLNESSTVSSFLTRGNRFMLRPAIRWLPRGDNSLQYFLGFAWTPHFTPYKNEVRLWQQVLLQNDGDDWWWAQRLRLEERWIQDTNDVSLRARYFFRIHRYLCPGSKTFGISLWDEVFFHLNSVSRGPSAGFDQIRTFIGPNFQLNPNTRLDTGYLNIYIAQGNASDAEMLHTFVIYAYFNL